MIHQLLIMFTNQKKQEILIGIRIIEFLLFIALKLNKIKKLIFL